MTAEGTCPTCGAGLPGEPITAKNIDLKRLADPDGTNPATAPWHFKLMLALLVAYLGWRIVALFL
jgi:hypothetical protein